MDHFQHTIGGLMIRKFSYALGCALFLFTSSVAQADDCSGVVQSVTVGPDGDFFANFGYNRMRICQLDANVSVDRGSSAGGTTTITAGRCQSLFSSFLTARASAKPVTARVMSTCSFVDGAYPNPYPFQFIF